MLRTGLAIAWLLASCSVARPPATHPDPVAADLVAFAQRQLAEFGIPGAAVAAFDLNPTGGGEYHLAQGLGSFRPAGEAMPADAVCRVASISKLFTASAAMVLVERGVLELDAPVTRYLPEFAPRSAFATPITLRHLLTHRAGLVRESPVGHYFDDSAPSLAATVASLNATELVHEPGTNFKYSNPGPGVVGEIIARVTGQPFARAVQELVLAPLQMASSSFASLPELLARVPDAAMWTYDGRLIPTPTWPFGYAPAANLYSTAPDLLQFARSWLPGQQPRILGQASLEAMWALPNGKQSGCGVGFFVRQFAGYRQVGHDGAVYGFASSLRALPDLGMAVAVVCTKDFANEVSDAIAERALLAMLAQREGRALPAPEFPQRLASERLRVLAGRYRCGADWVELHSRGGELFYDPNIGVRTRLRVAADGALVADDPLGMGGARRLVELPNGKLYDGEVEYLRDDAVPAPCPDELLPLLGEYGWDHNVLVVYEDHGQLGVLIEWVVRDLPERLGPDQYRFPPGMYGGDLLQFERDASGKVVAALVGGARFPRRPDPDPQFRITPLRPVAELLAEAKRAAEQELPTSTDALRPFDLVDLRALGPTLKLDIRYATANNFLGVPVYAQAIAKLQRPAAGALKLVQEQLAVRGLGLVVFDAYRPWQVTRVFHAATPAAMRHFVADPKHGSRHNRGCAVDLTLYDLATGEVHEMPSGYDEFTPRAYPDWPGGTSRQRYYRAVLRAAMEAAGFTIYEWEWWHFDYCDWRSYGVGDEPLTVAR